MDNIRTFLKWGKGYHEFNREERNLAAILYHVLLTDDNLSRFLNTIACDYQIVPAEAGIYFEYAYLRDLWFTIDDETTKREIIYRFLKPQNQSELERMSILEFNTHFGVGPVPSKQHIQNPSNWSIDKYSENIHDHEEFLKTCRFKWAFNAKPDIVIHLSKDYAICIECKFESGEGSYPTKPSEKAEFKLRNLIPVSQTALQKYIMEDLLGIETSYLFLVQKPPATSTTHKTLLWKEAFSGLAVDASPYFIKEWIQRL